MTLLTDKLRDQPIIYVTHDIERALGLSLNTSGYHIITNSTPFGKTVAKNNPNVLLIESNELLDTHELLTSPETIEFIKKLKNPRILVFKNTKVIEKICAEHKWKLLNPSAELAQKVEDKISQIEWLGDLARFLPEHEILVLKDVIFAETPFILQFNKSHTGHGTILIDREKKLTDLKIRFPDRPVRVTKYLEGIILTTNNVVTKDDILVGNINYQITGLAPFTDEPFATVGNDFSLANQSLSEKQKKQYAEIVSTIGKKLRANGWKGLFGIDVLLEKTSGKLFLIEINARQPAGTTFEAKLQEAKINIQTESGQKIEKAITTFQAHLMSLLDLDLSDKKLIEINNGAQIILRNQNGLLWNKNELESISEKLITEKFNVIPYTNIAQGSDLLRIQSERGIMKNDGEFNDVGEKLLSALGVR
ncbi:MAG: hypothetical protein A2821_00310 [Candidatus Magasanikbacteria bacterium RIFCSPHIGHO2_01_FULL_41_23]|uniref:ATP-grasp domain-containing protein n=1 Tax=Candidatus Magasanikbacteria bacterium RIFCSPLOWO2_01_FULL_40_15 TaxID=1798686 RepID=A0A1F6N3U5_9BACT|nr:MAG: hypothetical protein A2821_00310 [Candidatus Magasanikbacteria bacterium RIFCSPHIGHO2_01_FULL_41_23]OGH76565.1 MAG: hypothetical protein A3F22_04460 [Candidatus Magasanikbacteria bacterium RIFCSPHIGHO2_12_FULL_41_16]OGH78544.1 MAG: hypothetical protein A2983_02665 [Candidatus Magasanikbacteria bacterium RIFCSPLOWO2_01_FULL_40_15]